MARFTMEEIDSYGGQSNGSFFSLPNDKDVATVRFMYNTIDDVEGHAVHEIEINGKKRYVNCLRAYNEPVDNCPLCAAKRKVIAKIFVLIYDVDSEDVKIWDRGRTFSSKLSSLCSRYNPLVSTVFEIERNGKKGDTNTKYETYLKKTDEITLDDLPEVPQVLGSLVLDKSFEELQYFLEYGEFELVDEELLKRRGAEVKSGEQNKPVRRRTKTDDKQPTNPIGRRTAARAGNKL